MCFGLLKKLKGYCNYYDISTKSIIDIISDSKVIPMIRGKSFEFTLSDILKGILPRDKWLIENLNINAQPGIHDIDVCVTRKKDKKRIRVECKLTKNDSFRIKENQGVFQVKCMRSRTFSDNPSATRMAKSYGVNRKLLLMHADSYRQVDFDFVITSLGNSFWKTINERYTFNGNRTQFDLISNLFQNKFRDFRNFKKDAFNFLLYAKSNDLAVAPRNNLVCRKKECIKNGSQNNCGFIPNYPVINLNEVAAGNSPWRLLDNIEEEFNTF